MVEYKQPLQAGTSAVDGMYTYCVVQDIDLTNKVAHVVDQLGNPRQVSITRSLGPAAAYPKVGENWIISRQYGDWIFAVSVNNGLVTGSVGPQGPQGKPYNDPALNLLTDFSFDHWSAEGVLSSYSTFWEVGTPAPVVSRITSPEAYDDNGVKVTFNAATSSQRIESYDVYAITPGQRYLISVWAKGSNTTSCQLDVIFLANNPPTIPEFFVSGTGVFGLISGTLLTTDWALYQGLWTCPTGYTNARPVISAYGDSGDIVEIDRATVRIADVPNPFNGVPTGGGAFAVLAKNSGTDFDEYWAPGSVAPTANSVMYRDVNNRSQVADPSASADVATKNYVDARMPTGVMHPFAGSAAPSGYLLCDGSAVSRTTYADLFTVIGTTYGVGNGSTTFNIPNTLGRAIAGYDGSQTEFNTLGKTGGEKTHTLTTAEIPGHTHSINDPTHTHNIQRNGNQANSGGTGGIFGLQQNSGTSVSNTQSASTGITVNTNTGGDGAHNNLQPYISLNYIIKT
jgi:microcystin-dependent protein